MAFYQIWVENISTLFLVWYGLLSVVLSRLTLQGVPCTHGPGFVKFNFACSIDPLIVPGLVVI